MRTAKRILAIGAVAEMCENIRIIRYNVRPDEVAHVSITERAAIAIDAGK